MKKIGIKPAFSLSLFLCLTLIIASCIGTVRSHIFREKEQTEKEKEATTIYQPKVNGIKIKPPVRQDTVFVDLSPSSASNNPNAEPSDEFSAAFEKALIAFDKKSYDDACSEFTAIAETLPDGDSLRYEALFMQTECAIVNDELPLAIQMLETLSMRQSLPMPVMEKVLVRLGQVHCLLNDTKSAENAFSRFKKQFPNSPYIPLATCQSVK